MFAATRRRLFERLALLGFASLAARSAAAAPAEIDPRATKKDAEIACLYHCDFGDPARFGQMLTNINNHLSVYGFDPFKVKIVVVVHGQGLKFFLSDRTGTPWEKDVLDPDLEKRIAALAQYGVEFFLCKITYERQKIDLAKTRDAPYFKFVPSGVAAVGELQARGFGYLKTG